MSSGARRVLRSVDPHVERHLVELLVQQGRGLGALDALAVGDRRGRRGLDQVRQQPGERQAQRHPVVGVGEPEVEASRPP